MPRASRIADMDFVSAPDAAARTFEPILDVTLDRDASRHAGDAPGAAGLSPARDLQAQLADAFIHGDADGECDIFEERYPLALSYGVTLLVCAGFWIALGLAVRTMIAA
ncbi:hypothetical protein L2D00_06470 [Hyphomonadaceae bacterium BL14]|nr:hypothetical protein L2D00_06470 [Hyphomonadaceae bacterium BL14]